MYQYSLGAARTSSETLNRNPDEAGGGRLQVTRKKIVHVVRWGLSGLACIFLMGCFFTPGRFQSELDIRRDGRFTYSYVGEIVFLIPEQYAPPPWSDAMAVCFGEQNGGQRPCTQPEITNKRQAYEEEAQREQEAGEDVSRLIGFNPLEVKANVKLAADLEQYPGWKRVTYLGKSTFEVDYKLSGTLDRDFVFPVIPQAQMAMPFVNVARSSKGAVSISAAGLASQQLRKLIIGQTPKADRDDPYYLSQQSILSRANGTFTVITDSTIVSADSAKSQSGALQRIQWIIDGNTSETPQIELRLETQP